MQLTKIIPIALVNTYTELVVVSLSDAFFRAQNAPMHRPGAGLRWGSLRRSSRPRSRRGEGIPLPSPSP